MSSDWTTTETPAPPEISPPTYSAPPPMRPRRSPGPFGRGLRAAARGAGGLGWGLNLLLVVITFGTLWLAHGPQYAVCTILILGSHEMGHYVFCRRYGVDATLPYFLPAPPLFMFGTFGAVIRMRPPIPSRRALFDIGIAGPIAGFLVALPILALGIATSQVISRPADTALMEFGDPLLVHVLARWFHGSIPDTSILLGTPMFLAGWFGLLVTAMNLFPVGQLDGGHISYALAPKTHRTIARLVAVGMLLLVIGTVAVNLISPWLLWTVVLLLLSRFGHPPVEAADEPLGLARIALAAAAAVIFAVSFMPIPIYIPLPF